MRHGRTARSLERRKHRAARKTQKSTRSVANGLVRSGKISRAHGNGCESNTVFGLFSNQYHRTSIKCRNNRNRSRPNRVQLTNGTNNDVLQSLPMTRPKTVANYRCFDVKTFRILRTRLRRKYYLQIDILIPKQMKCMYTHTVFNYFNFNFKTFFFEHYIFNFLQILSIRNHYFFLTTSTLVKYSIPETSFSVVTQSSTLSPREIKI